MSLFRVKHDKNNPYVTLNNQILKNKNLSWRAKGIYFYAFSRPNDWSFNLKDLINQSLEGRDAVIKALKQLEEHGYLERNPIRDAKGKWLGHEWIFYETTKESKKDYRTPENPNADKPNAENQGFLTKYGNVLSNEGTKKEKKQKKECPDGSAVSSHPPEAERLFDLFFDLKKKNNSKAKPPNKKRWIQEIDLMNRRDGYSWEEIEAMINFSQEHHFWKTNILSAGKLRKQAEKLFLQMNNQKKGGDRQEQIEKFIKEHCIDTDNYTYKFFEKKLWIMTSNGHPVFEIFIGDKSLFEQLESFLRKKELWNAKR